MQELDTNKPLTRIDTKDYTYFTEQPLDVVKTVWKKKEWVQIGETIIPYDPYNTTISTADIADRYLHFSLPLIEKDYPKIADNLKRKLNAMTKRERDWLSYKGIKLFVEREIYEFNYYK